MHRVVSAACRGLVLLPLVSALLPAQGDVVRRSTFVRVVDGVGQPVASAEVTLAGGLPHLGAGVSPQDLQVVLTDARGRAQCKLLPGLCYVAWALGPGRDGERVTTPVEGYFGAGAVVELLAATTGRDRSVRLAGTAAWRDHGPLRVVALTPFPGKEVELPVVDDTVQLPPEPFATCLVLTATGAPLGAFHATAERLELLPPQRLTVRTVDAAGRPLGGVPVHHRVTRVVPWRFDGFGGVAGERSRELGRTGADGLLEVVVPAARLPLQPGQGGDLLLFAAAPGCPAVAGGLFNQGYYQNDRHAEPPADGVLEFRCAPVAELAGRIGRAPAGTVAHLAGVCKLSRDRSGAIHDPRAFTVPIGADGSFRFVDVPLDLHSARLLLLPPSGHDQPLPLFAGRSGRQLPPELTAVEQGRLETLPLAELRLQIGDVDGGPARGAIVYVAPGDQRDVLLRDSLVRVPVDAAGRTTLSLAPGTWVLLAVGARGVASSRLELGPGASELPLPLQPFGSMAVVLRDAAGAPIVGAQVRAATSRTRASGDPAEALMQSFANAFRARWAQCRTGADGSLRIPFVAAPGMTFRATLVWPQGATTDFAIEAGEEPVALRPK